MRAQLLTACVILVLGGVAAAGTGVAGTAGGASGGSGAAAPPDVEDGDAWLVAHGSKDPEKRLGNACCCVEVRVGRPAERALDCKEEEPGGEPESADIAVKEVIRVVRAGKVVKVLDAWVGLENLDRPYRSPPWLALRLAVDASGRAATIVDPGDSRYACKGARRGSAEFDRWLERVCASRGTYRWRGGRFVRGAK